MFVQLYRSTDLNSPVLSGTNGSLINLLNRVLVDGYTTASVTSITRTGSVATVTLAAANTTLLPGDHVRISGAAQAEYNGDFEITVTGSTTFTYPVTGSPATPATGTLLYAKSPLGWTRPFAAGTNSQTYRSSQVSSNQFYLQVIDNGATTGGAREAQVYAAEAMSGDQTVTTGRFPTAALMPSGLAWAKSNEVNANAKGWIIIGDGRTFYYFPQTINTFQPRGYGFGHFITYKAGDAYNTFIVGETSFSTQHTTGLTTGDHMTFGVTTPKANNSGWLARSYTQSGATIQFNMFGSGIDRSPGNPASFVIWRENTVDGSFQFAPVLCVEATGVGPHIRGRFPGYYSPLFNAFSNIYNQDIITVTSPINRPLMGLQCCTLSGSGTSAASYGMAFFDIQGPWN